MLKKTRHPVDGVPPVRTNVSPVCDVCEEDQCGVLISQPVMKIMQHLLQMNSFS